MGREAQRREVQPARLLGRMPKKQASAQAQPQNTAHAWPSRWTADMSATAVLDTGQMMQIQPAEAPEHLLDQQLALFVELLAQLTAAQILDLRTAKVCCTYSY